MRIAIGGISVENSNFSPISTTLDDFTIYTGIDLLNSGRYPFLIALSAEFIPTLFARAWPGGEVTASTYHTLKSDLLERLAAVGQIEGLYLDLHGAMKVEGLEDAEADLAAAVREIVGPDVLIAASMDLHGNISQAYIDQIDMLTAYRTAPHRDMMRTRMHACAMLVQALQLGIRPEIACIPIPVLLPGEATRTDMEPGHSLWKSLHSTDALSGVLDASLFVGFAWVDEPRAHAAAVVTGTDPTVIQREAQKLAQAYWEARAEFNYGVPSGSIDECIEQALAAPESTVFISDSGDNPTAGAVGDIPLFIERLLAHAVPNAVVAAIRDAETVTRCRAAGIGATVSVELGGRLDTCNGTPLPVTGRVLHIESGDASTGDQVVLRVDNVTVIVTERREAFTTVADFAQVGINPLDHKIVVIKLGYLFPDLLRVATLTLMALSPGVSDLHVERLGHQRIVRPIYPLDADMEWQA